MGSFQPKIYAPAFYSNDIKVAISDYFANEAKEQRRAFLINKGLNYAVLLSGTISGNGFFAAKLFYELRSDLTGENEIRDVSKYFANKLFDDPNLVEIYTPVFESWIWTGVAAGGKAVNLLANKLSSNIPNIGAIPYNSNTSTALVKYDPLFAATQKSLYGGELTQLERAAIINTYGNVLPTGTEAIVTSPYNSLMELVDKLDFSTGRNQATFYSGPGNREIATQFAIDNNKLTIEMTPGGRFLSDLDLFNSENLTPEEATKIWAMASRKYAGQASGNVYGLVQGARPQSIFVTEEWPVLLIYQINIAF